jgi:3-oxoacyl-[acyl-carrier-protein] synthase III
MNEYSAGILGLGAYLPKTIVTNDDLKGTLDTSDEWIVERTGIRCRHKASPYQVTSDLASEAAWTALSDAGISPKDIDLILVATITPDSLMPSTASQVQMKIGAIRAAALDISAACSGFMYGMTIAQQFIESGAMKNILVIGAEILTRSVNWKDRSVCILFGDGAGAAVVGRVPRGQGILAYYLGADGNHPPALLSYVGSGTTRSTMTEEAAMNIQMNGKAIYKFGVEILPMTVEAVLQKADFCIDDVDIIIPHQANKRIIEAAAENLGVPISKFYINIDRRANTSAASIPIAMCDAKNESVLKKGSTVLLAGFGGGLTWGGMVLKY